MNLYGFVGNDGVGLIDSLGHFPILVEDGTGGVTLNEVNLEADVHVSVEFDCNGAISKKEARNSVELLEAVNSNPDCCIKSVRFLGHASKNIQFVGRNDFIQVGKYNGKWKIMIFSGNNPISTELPLAKRMCKEKTEVVLDGCNTGRVWPWEDKNEEGINISRDFSEALKGTLIQGNRGKSVGFPSNENLWGIARYYFNGKQI